MEAPEGGAVRGEWMAMSDIEVRIDGLFPRAAGLRAPGRAARGVGEPAVPAEFADPPSERLLQCVWYDAALRPPGLRTSDGEPVIVENPGVWNLEAGPDFLGASLRIGRGERRMAGDVELHVRPMDWCRHEHGDDPRYAAVRFHVTYHPGPAADHALPPGTVRIALRDALAAAPGFSFDAVDPAAYPFAARAAPTPCAMELAGWHPDDREALLEAAGEERLRRKAQRIARRIADAGAEQVLHEELAAALGYKHNKAPFRLLATRVPIETLRAESAGDPDRARALLLGAAGLLPVETGGDADARRLWDHWWKLRGRWETAALPRDRWRLDGLRPLNRPERRLQAAAWLATRPETPAATLLRLATLPPHEFVRAALEWLDVPCAGTTGLAARPGLLGRSRATAILINVLVPTLAAIDARGLFDAGLLRALPDEPSNGIERTMALTLFGPDHPPALHRGSLRRQGLVQVFQDFCLNDRSRCASCGLPALLRAFRRPDAGGGQPLGAGTISTGRGEALSTPEATLPASR